MNMNDAVVILTKAGYVVEDAQPNGIIKIRDPYWGYQSGVYAVDGYNKVYITPQQASKFIEDRRQ